MKYRLTTLLLLGLTYGCGGSKAKVPSTTSSVSSTGSNCTSASQRGCAEWEPPTDDLSGGNKSADVTSPDASHHSTPSSGYSAIFGSSVQKEAARKCTGKHYYFDRSTADQIGDKAVRSGSLSDNPDDWPACEKTLRLVFPLSQCGTASNVLKQMEDFVQASETNRSKVVGAYQSLIEGSGGGFTIDQCVFCPKGNEKDICLKSSESGSVPAPQDVLIVVAGKYVTGEGTTIRKIELPANLFKPGILPGFLPPDKRED